jgi:hypothetical protein
MSVQSEIFEWVQRSDSWKLNLVTASLKPALRSVKELLGKGIDG